MVEDFLELKASLVAEKTKALKEFLFSQALDDFEISAVEGFLLSNHLVLIGPNGPPAVNKVVFLNSKNGRIQIQNLSR